MRTFAQNQEELQQKSNPSGLKTLPPTESNEKLSDLHLQRNLGNQAVLRLLRSNSAPTTIQPKLTVSTPGDSYEQEADHFAEHVMNMPGGGCSSCETVQQSQEHQHLQPKQIDSGNSEQVAAPAIVHEVLASPGQPLDASARAFFEPRFGYDFSQVRVHSDAAAQQSAQEVNAKAYTVGNNIVIDTHQFSPTTQEGQHLLAHELTHVVQQSAADKTTVLRRQPAGTKPEKRAVKTPQELTEQIWTSLLAFSARTTPELVRVGKSVEAYLKRYDAAHAVFAARLSEAQREAAEREKWERVMVGIIIGTGVGLAASELYTATTLVGKLLYKVVGGSISAGIGQVVGGSATIDFTPPPELNNDKVARGHLERLLEAWRALALMQAATLAFSPFRDAQRDAPRGDKPSTKGGPAPAATSIDDELERLSAALANTDAALNRFLTTVDTPVLSRDQITIEQDIWIAWMAQSSSNANTAMGDNPISRRLNELRIWGRLLHEGEGLNYRLLGAAQEEQERVKRIGHVGVVIVPPQAPVRGVEKPGVVRLRGDAYSAVGRADANPTGSLEYVKAVAAPGTFLMPGEVVMAKSTTPSGLVVERLGPSLAVGDYERVAALQILGIKEKSYLPEAAEALYQFMGVVFQQLDHEMREAMLQTNRSDDGVLVTEADGTKLVLVAPLTSAGLKGAALRRDHSGAALVIAVEVDPQKQLAGPVYFGAGIIMMNYADARVVADQIRGAHRAAKQRKQP